MKQAASLRHAAATVRGHAYPRSLLDELAAEGNCAAQGRAAVGSCDEMFESIHEDAGVPDFAEGPSGISQTGVLGLVLRCGYQVTQQSQCRARSFDLSARVVNLAVRGARGFEHAQRLIDLSQENPPGLLRGRFPTLELCRHGYHPALADRRGPPSRALLPHHD